MNIKENYKLQASFLNTALLLANKYGVTVDIREDNVLWWEGNEDRVTDAVNELVMLYPDNVDI